MRSASDATTRDQRRKRLQTELDRCGLSESATWVEAALDTLEPDYTPPTTADTVSSLRRFAVDLNVALTAQDIDEPVPAWLAPPERARYHLLISPHSRGAVPVQLERDAEEWLNRVYDVRLPVGGLVLLDVWLDWAKDTSTERSKIEAFIGPNLVGSLDSTATRLYASALEAAAARGELPITIGKLRRRSTSPRYILEIYGAPATG